MVALKQSTPAISFIRIRFVLWTDTLLLLFLERHMDLLNELQAE